MDAEALRTRSKSFALQIIEFYQSLPQRDVRYTIGQQLLRSGTSIGANYRAVCRARSRKELYAKLNIVVEEADETIYWLELLEQSTINTPELTSLLSEANELLAIFASSKKKIKKTLN